MPKNWKKVERDTWYNFKTNETVSLKGKNVSIEKGREYKVKTFKTETKARNFARSHMKKNKR